MDNFKPTATDLENAVHLGGITEYQFHPSEQNKLLNIGIGITNLAPRTSAQASEISDDEFKKRA